MISKEWLTKVQRGDKNWISHRLFLEPNEININIISNYTPLIKAIQYGLNANFINFLLEKGADVNCITDFGDNAFCWALLNNNVEVAKLLVEYGSDIHFKSPKTHPFRFKFNDEMLSYLVSIGASLEGIDYKHSFYKTTIFQSSEVVEKYLHLQSLEFIKWYKSERLENLF